MIPLVERLAVEFDKERSHPTWLGSLDLATIHEAQAILPSRRSNEIEYYLMEIVCLRIMKGMEIELLKARGRSEG